ncbi:MAG: hypothetical protein IJD28_05825 [Deferribacterales bacterium]|nr:hypothetical protein [Deferribacterales bacterium]
MVFHIVKKVSYIFTVVLVSLSLISCATIMRDSEQSVRFYPTNVDNVNLKVTDKKGEKVYEGTAPVVLPLLAGDVGYFDAQRYKIEATKEGYQTEIIELNSKISAWYMANLLFGGLIGFLIIDPMSGDMFYLDKEVRIDMKPVE